MTKHRSTKGLFPHILDGQSRTVAEAVELCRLSVSDIQRALLDDPTLSTAEAVRKATRKRKAKL